MEDITKKPELRNAFVAGLLNFLYPGLGYAYCGRLLRAIIFSCVINFVSYPVYVHNNLFFAPLVIVFYFYGVFDAAKTAKLINNSQSELKRNIAIDIVRFIIFSIIIIFVFALLLVRFFPGEELRAIKARGDSEKAIFSGLKARLSAGDSYIAYVNNFDPVKKEIEMVSVFLYKDRVVRKKIVANMAGWVDGKWKMYNLMVYNFDEKGRAQDSRFYQEAFLNLDEDLDYFIKSAKNSGFVLNRDINEEEFNNMLIVAKE